MGVQFLHRIDTTQNMARFYRVELLQDLFGMTTVERAWGRIGSRGQRLMVSFQTVHSAEVVTARLVRSKLKRGYRRLEDVSDLHPTAPVI